MTPMRAAINERIMNPQGIAQNSHAALSLPLKDSLIWPLA